MEAQKYLTDCLLKVIDLKGQDLFLKVGAIPRIRCGSRVSPFEMPPLSEPDVQEMIQFLLNAKQKAILEKKQSVDFAFSMAGTSQRFRGNLFAQQGSYSMVIRTLWKNIPSFEELSIPPVLKKIALERSGIILVGGTVSSGKTTTLHAMVEMMNQNIERHIITVEDPVEYLHEDKKCVINQREIGQDAEDFPSALKYVVRQSPDVVMIGEMRDADTFNFALGSAEVGRLVLSTVHAKSVAQIFERVLGFFAPEQRDRVLDQLYPSITCLVVQKLLTGKDGTTLVPAFEILIGNYMMRQLIFERKFDKLRQAIRNSAREGMQTMDDSLLSLWKAGKISAETALAASDLPQELEIQMKGIKIDGQSGRILGS